MGLYIFIKQRIDFIRIKIAFRKNNKHNSVVALNPFPLEVINTIGRHTYGGLFVVADNTRSKLTIGNFCAIAPDVRFILSGEHDINNISTFPFKRQIATGE